LPGDDDESDAAGDDKGRSFASETGKERLGREESRCEEGEGDEKEQKGGGDGNFAEVARENCES
jgi:hypothetical protein